MAAANEVEVVSESRKPNYGATKRCLQVFLELLRTPAGRDLDTLADQLSVSTRTMTRYTKILQESLFDETNQPLVEVRQRGARRHLRVRCRYPR